MVGQTRFPLTVIVAFAALIACGASATSGVDGGSAVTDAGKGDVAKTTTDAGKTGDDSGHDEGDAAKSAVADASADHHVSPGDDAGTVDAHTADSGEGGAPLADGAVPDPNAPGPYTYAELDDTMSVAASENSATRRAQTASRETVCSV